MSNALLIFVRFPRPGKVKTRLAQALGNEQATEFYYLCADNIIKEAGKLAGKVDLFIFGADPADETEIARWAGPQFNVMIQHGETLGQRLENAFKIAFKNGLKKVIITASDTPDLSIDILQQAILAMENNDIVIGPCYDGGYYLIGMKRLHEELFHDISWSTEKVYSQTLNIIKENGLNIYKLQTLLDIDSENDLYEWAKHSNAKPPALEKFLKTIGIKLVGRG